MIRKLGIGFVAVAGALLAAGVVYQRLGEYRDRKRFRAPGRLVPADGCKLHFWGQGSGVPAVILEAGIAATSASWSPVQPKIAEFTGVASYDRAGLGWSERCREARTLRRMTHELAALLEQAHITPPYVLVAHSFGALVVRAFAHERPRQVVGLVLVDPVSIAAWSNCSDSDRRRLAFGVKLSRRGGWLARCGVVRFALAVAAGGTRATTRLTTAITKASAGRGTPFLARLVGEIRKLPAEVLPAVKSHWSRAQSFEAMAQYLEALPDCATSAALSLPLEIPLTILSADSATDAELRERDTWVTESSHGRQIKIPNTGHWLQLERPDVVIAAVKELVEEYRKSGVSS